jgi:hypothetical protein
MALTVQELTKLLNESSKAKQALNFILDYVDLVNAHRDELPSDTQVAGGRIKDRASEIEKDVEELRYHMSVLLDKMPLDMAEIKTAANKMLLVQSNVSQAMNWVQGQQRRYGENSYWWRHWQAIYDILKEKEG